MTEGTASAPARGMAVIADMLPRLPDRPGVYRMIDADGEVLYVGKARSLRKRVAAYARGKAHAERLGRMIAATATMEFVTTETETDALLLEANLIKRLRPRFNVLMRDDKSFPYILVTHDHPAPAIVKHRGARARKGAYFGPFASALAVGRTINALQKAFLLRSCSDSVFESRTRPCLLYQIKRCSGPCTNEIGPDAYRVLVDEAEAFLSGGSETVRRRLASEMEEAAARLDYEMAAVLRDRLSAFAAVTGSQGINPRGVAEADVFAAHQDGGQTCVQVFFFRAHQNWGNRAYFPKADKTLGAAEVLGAFLAQFYDDKPVPRLVLLSHEVDEAGLLAEALSARAGIRVEIAVPKRGEKRDLLEHALLNAREALGRRLAESSSQGKLLGALADLIGRDEPLRRIEVFDNSHAMGANAVGAMIVAGPDGFVKSQYRKWNIRSTDIAPGDDFGMMREVLTRRFTRLLEESGVRPAVAADEDAALAWPDLVVVDGGRGQLEAARGVLADLGVAEDVALLAVSKGTDRDAGRERLHMVGRDPFQLEPRDPVLFFLQRLRDESHRFAIGAHRARRSRAMTVTSLDEIEGVGPARKRALLMHFGSAKAVARASLDDLLRAPGVNAATARAVWSFFNEGAR
jgi:excinuclease ABC subunit C